MSDAKVCENCKRPKGEGADECGVGVLPEMGCEEEDAARCATAAEIARLTAEREARKADIAGLLETARSVVEMDGAERKRLTAELEAAKAEAADHKAHWEAAEAKMQAQTCDNRVTNDWGCAEYGVWSPRAKAYRCQSCEEAGR